MGLTKKFFQEHLELLSEIALNQERLIAINEEIEMIPAKKNDGMPHAKNVRNDTIAIKYVKREEITEELEKLRSREKEETEEIKNAIYESKLKPEESQVITLRYIDGIEWQRVLKIMFSRYKSYEYKKHSYERQMYRLRKRAFEKMGIK